MRGTVIAILLIGLTTICLTQEAGATPKFRGNCLNQKQIGQLFKKYSDVEQLGPWSTEKIQAKPHYETSEIGTSGVIKSGGIIGASIKLDLRNLPKDKTVIATLCGTLGESPDQNRAAGTAEEKMFYPKGKPGNWCGYGGPRKGVCSKYRQSWFQDFNPKEPSIVFFNGAQTNQRGFIWAYVRPSSAND